MNIDIAVVVATFGRFEPLLDSLEDLLAQEGAQFEIIVVDQNRAWPPGSQARRDAVARDPRVIWLGGIAPGVVAARNLGVERSCASIIVFVDDDVRVPARDFLAAHLDAYSDPALAAVCGREVHPPVGLTVPIAEPVRGLRREPDGAAEQSPVLRLLRFDRSSPLAAEIAVFSTCNGSVRREAFLSVGGFDENFAGASYGDDADLILRMHAVGLRVLYDPRPWLVHLLAPVGGLRLSDVGNRFSEADRALSGWIFALRHGRGQSFWMLVYGWVLRRTLLLKRNTLRPWRWPAIVVALWRSFRAARKAVLRGPCSRFFRARSEEHTRSGI